MNKKYICANWKMNTDINECEKICVDIKNNIDKLNLNDNIIIVLNLPFTHIYKVKEIFKDYKNIKIGAQNLYCENEGAYTGEISAKMLVSLGVEYVIIGHSERRNLFCEDDEIINKKIKIALENNLKPIFCIGENLEQKEKGIEKDILKKQIDKALNSIDKNLLENIIIAYEPVWAIGTKKAMDCYMANELIDYLKKYVQYNYKNIKMLYGGSVDDTNIISFLDKSIIDGALIGKASLDSSKFTNIINEVQSYSF